jgi:hypothetical protein
MEEVIGLVLRSMFILGFAAGVLMNAVAVAVLRKSSLDEIRTNPLGFIFINVYHPVLCGLAVVLAPVFAVIAVLSLLFPKDRATATQ